MAINSEESVFNVLFNIAKSKSKVLTNKEIEGLGYDKNTTRKMIINELLEKKKNIHDTRQICFRVTEKGKIFLREYVEELIA